ncbi:hypothetical protein DSO57_1029469 [Entomophthora muscae]|uniref:Uncharacterized protein n=1 Tax=Entomophthora muscae TaxID=34485 RepID=A0ACC2TZ27_9FUNG|nr:hypothetical protein DSO57_1029469 [Entomophthora muscae]
MFFKLIFNLDGLKTPRTKVDPEQLKFAAASIPVNISLSNTPSGDELKKLKKNYENLQKQLEIE